MSRVRPCLTWAQEDKGRFWRSRLKLTRFSQEEQVQQCTDLQAALPLCFTGRHPLNTQRGHTFLPHAAVGSDRSLAGAAGSGWAAEVWLCFCFCFVFLSPELQTHRHSLICGPPIKPELGKSNTEQNKINRIKATWLYSRNITAFTRIRECRLIIQRWLKHISMN